jgi:hypothetical protein
MNANPCLTSAALALLLMAAQTANPAHAAAGAEARIYNLSFSLVDLTPLDGIAPSFSFVNDPDVNRFRTELTVNVANTLLATNDAAINADFSFIATLDLDRSVVGNQAIASTTATSARAWALSEAKGTAAAFASAESNLLFSGDFGLQLSPNSAITISADATVTAFDNGAAGAQGFAFEFARAESFLRVRGSDPGDGSGPQDDLSTRLAETMVDAVADSVDSSGTLSVTFTNLSADPKFGYLSVRSTVGAYGVTPVPEPATWALALGGLGALVWRVRRVARG